MTDPERFYRWILTNFHETDYYYFIKVPERRRSSAAHLMKRDLLNAHTTGVRGPRRPQANPSPAQRQKILQTQNTSKPKPVLLQETSNSKLGPASPSPGMCATINKLGPTSPSPGMWRMRFRAPNIGGPGSISGQGTRSQMLQLRVHTPQLKIPHVTTKAWHSQINAF